MGHYTDALNETTSRKMWTPPSRKGKAIGEYKATLKNMNGP